MIKELLVAYGSSGSFEIGLDQASIIINSGSSVLQTSRTEA